jgi:hypothetical protein
MPQVTRHMRSLSFLLLVGLTVLPAVACNKAETPTAPTPVPTPAPSAQAPPVLTFEPDTLTPVGQAVALTYGSRSQEPGKIVVAVTGFNLRNEISPTVNGVSAVRGRLKWDEALLEIDGVGVGDLFGGNSGGNVDNGGWPEVPGTFPFGARRNDQARVTGSGELVLLRLRPRTGITTGTTRIELEPFLANEGGPFPFMTPLLLFPYQPPRGNQLQNAYGATIAIRPGS